MNTPSRPRPQRGGQSAARSSENPLRHELLAGLAAAVLALVGAALALRLWEADLGVPFVYTGDGQLFHAMITAALDNGWYLSNPDLGAPLGSEWHDFPVASGDTLHLLEVHVLSLFSNDPATVLNLFYLLGYALIAVSAFAVFRLLAISTGPAVVCATLYALLPYHFLVGESHPFHTAYWMIPIACFLVLAVLAGRPLFARRETAPSRLLAFASRSTLATLAACVVVGSAGSNYHALFAAGLVAIAGVIAAIREDDWRRPLLSGVIIVAAIVATVGLNATPTILYEARNGANETVGKRFPAESETASLTLASQLMPSPGHRIEALAELRRDYYESSPTPEAAAVPGLGLVGAVGLLSLLGHALAAAAGAVRRSSFWSLHGNAAAVVVASLLIATTGGFSVLIAHLLSPQLRVWARFNVFIAFFSLIAVALLLDLAIKRLGNAARGRVLAGVLLATVLVIGYLDQTSPAYVPTYSETRAEFESDEEFVAAIEADLDPDAAVFQLPYVPFPEWPGVGRSSSFDLFRPYLHSSDLRWSYAAMQERPQDWQPGLIDDSVALALPGVATAGFAGIVIDRFAYADEGAELETAFSAELEAEPLVSEDGRMSFFDLREYAASLRRAHPPQEIEALRAATLSPVVVEPGPGLARAAPLGSFSPELELTGPSGQITLVNPSAEERSATLEVALDPGAGGLDVALPASQVEEVRPGRPLRAELALAPGATAIGLAAADGVVPLALDVRVTDSALGPFDPPASRDVPLQPQAAEPAPVEPS